MAAILRGASTDFEVNRAGRAEQGVVKQGRGEALDAHSLTGRVALGRSEAAFQLGGEVQRQPDAEAPQSSHGPTKTSGIGEGLIAASGAELSEILALLCGGRCSAHEEQGQAQEHPEPSRQAPRREWVGSHGSNRYDIDWGLTRSPVTGGLVPLASADGSATIRGGFRGAPPEESRCRSRSSSASSETTSPEPSV